MALKCGVISFPKLTMRLKHFLCNPKHNFKLHLNFFYFNEYPQGKQHD